MFDLDGCRLEAIAENAELSEHSPAELRQLCDELLKACRQATSDHSAAAAAAAAVAVVGNDENDAAGC